MVFILCVLTFKPELKLRAKKQGENIISNLFAQCILKYTVSFKHAHSIGHSYIDFI